ncbi:anti-sigma factor [Phyllobacterium sp. LjRoot231]
MTDLKHAEMPSDEMLVAFLDGELEGAERARIDTLVKTDKAVGARYEFLSRSEMAFYDAFQPLLENAPTAKLEAILSGLPASVTAEPVPRDWSRRGFMAAAIAFVFVGVAADRAYIGMQDVSSERDGSEWRAVVAEYLSLYTPETLANLTSDEQSQNAQLRNVGDKLGLALPVEAVSLPGIPLKRAQILQYDGKPLGQIAYLDPEHGPMALCIVQSSKGAAAPQTERRRGMNVVYWSDQAHGYMLIGRNPADRLNDLAERVRTALNA